MPRDLAAFDHAATVEPRVALGAEGEPRSHSLSSYGPSPEFGPVLLCDRYSSSDLSGRGLRSGKRLPGNAGNEGFRAAKKADERRLIAWGEIG